MSPNDEIHCLLIQPQFSSNNYWNYAESAQSIGAKTPAPPLGLLTVAALLPEAWSLELVDLNVRDVSPAEWERADVVCVGGMLPQQPGILAVVARARESGKYVVVGGADPSSQPELYEAADALVLGEGEASIPLWLDSWRKGRPNGRFEAAQRPDVTSSPVPRFDLIDFDDYVHVGVQFSRGCPFNCEFCDIIELYGRVPRVKTADQVLAELDEIYRLGYRGWVDIVDDNFIGNKRLVKPLLAELETWSAERGNPFFFSTETTINVADDATLLRLLQNADFRALFIGIETPDPELLVSAQKRINATQPIAERVQRIYDHGISVAAGFIMGFDNEIPGNDRAIIDCVEETGVVMAMVGLLVALPNTQLARRLQRQQRLLSADMELVTDVDHPYRILTVGQQASGEDQSAGLNFVTTRDRVEIYAEYRRVIEVLYSPRGFMDRVLATSQRLKPQYRHQPGLWEWRRNIRGLVRNAVSMTRNPTSRRLYWRNTLRTLVMGLDRFDFAQRMMSLYPHFERQTRHVRDALDANIDFAIHHASYPRSVADGECAKGGT